MKSLLSIVTGVALVFTAPSGAIWAKELKKTTTVNQIIESSKDKKTDNKANQVTHQLSVEHIQLEGRQRKIKATISNAKKVKGVFGIQVNRNGKYLFTKEQQTNTNTFSYIIDENKYGGGKYEYAVFFAGSIDGQLYDPDKAQGLRSEGQFLAPYKISSSYTFLESGKVKMTVIIPDAKKVKGVFDLGIAKIPGKTSIKQTKSSKVNNCTFIIDLNQYGSGEYEYNLTFKGMIDGQLYDPSETYGIGVQGQFEKEGNSTLPTSLTSNYDTKQLEGGKLPKTATNYPVNITIVSVLLLVAGVGLLARRRHST